MSGTTKEATGDERPTPTRATISLRTAVVMVGAAVGIFFVGVYAANAIVVPGTRGGHTRTALTVAGALTGVVGRHPTTFTFRNTASGMICTPPAVDITPTPPSGAFSAEVDIERCPAALFDGADVTVTAEVRDAADAAVLTTPVATVNPVPYARYADHYGTPDCPVGYQRNTTDSTFAGDTRLCQRQRSTSAVYDEVVRVGTGATAFWIDRYEDTLWDDPTGASGRWYGRVAGDIPGSFPVTGQYTSAPLYALSHREETPSAHVTWFQANAACRAAGKRLPSGDEWLAAARGTPDPGESDGALGACVTARSTGRVSTGVSGRCRSEVGAMDMIGNLWEWTAEWYASPLESPSSPGPRQPWPSGFGEDGTWGVTSSAFATYPAMSSQVGLPVAALRGGDYGSGARAGLFALYLEVAPSHAQGAFGFRCVIPR